MAMARSGAGKREAVRTSAALAEKTEAEMGAEVTAVARAVVVRAAVVMAAVGQAGAGAGWAEAVRAVAASAAR